MVDIVAGDIGGTNARFARAKVTRGRQPILGRARVYRTADYPGLDAAWAAFRKDEGGDIPTAASLAVAGPVASEVVKFTNSPWMFQPRTLPSALGLDKLTLINDFGAVAHAVALMNEKNLVHIAGPDTQAGDGITTIVGLGTGLGVAQLLRRDGRHFTIETEGAHGDFAPLDELEDKILLWLRHRYMRASDERVISGPALANLYEALAAIQGAAIVPRDDAALWDAAIGGSDTIASIALDRMVMSFGSVTGDLALQHGANQIVISGGIANRIVDRLKEPSFHQRFCAKGRYMARMQTFPIRLLTYDQPGLFGAAVAFAEEHL